MGEGDSDDTLALLSRYLAALGRAEVLVHERLDTCACPQRGNRAVRRLVPGDYTVTLMPDEPEPDGGHAAARRATTPITLGFSVHAPGTAR
jgi:hypothetical protein